MTIIASDSAESDSDLIIPIEKVTNYMVREHRQTNAAGPQ